MPYLLVHVGKGNVVVAQRPDQTDLEGRLHRWLIEAWKRLTGVGRLELRRGHVSEMKIYKSEIITNEKPEIIISYNPPLIPFHT